MASLALFLLGAATAFDLRTGKIPNRLIALGYVIGAIAQIHSPPEAFYHLVYAVATILLLYPLFLIRGFGAGDIKLFSALSLYCAPAFLAQVMMYSLFAGAGISAGRLLWCRARKREMETHYIHYTVCILLAYLYRLIQEAG